MDVKGFTIKSIYSGHKCAVTVMSDPIYVIRENMKMSKGIDGEICDISAELDRVISED